MEVEDDDLYESWCSMTTIHSWTNPNPHETKCNFIPAAVSALLLYDVRVHRKILQNKLDFNL